MSVQNPTIPTPTQAKGIDIAVYDMQARLDTSLTWLTNGMGRAYRLSKVEVNRAAIFLPEVRLNDGKFGYFACTPDNDKQGQNFFVVGDASFPDFQNNFYGLMSYPVSIIFSANLETIDSALLATEDYTEHLIQDVREALIRDPRGRAYRIVSIDSIQREFEDVFAEFDVNNDRGIAHNPMTHFRVNMTVQLREDCTDSSLNRCAAILQNLSQDELLNCILPTYDFSSTTTQTALTAQQVTDLTNWLCGGAGYQNTHSLAFNGVSDFVEWPDDAVYNFEKTQTFTFSAWIKTNSITTETILIGRYLPNNPFTGWYVSLRNGSINLNLNKNTSNRLSVFSTGTVSLGVWTHIAVTYDGSALAAGASFYINGVLQSNTVFADNLTALTIQEVAIPRIGSNSNTNAVYDGNMTEARLWNVEQNAAFILDDYNSGAPKEAEDKVNAIALPRFGPGANWSGLNGFWVFDDESAQAVESFKTGVSIKAIRTTDVP